MEVKQKIIGYKNAPWNLFTRDKEQIPIYQLVCAACEKPIEKPFEVCCDTPTQRKPLSGVSETKLKSSPSGPVLDLSQRNQASQGGKE